MMTVGRRGVDRNGRFEATPTHRWVYPPGFGDTAGDPAGSPLVTWIPAKGKTGQARQRGAHR